MDKLEEADDYFQHKKGCIWENAPPATAEHQVPIGCVTTEILLVYNKELHNLVKQRDTEIHKLKADLYDWEHMD